MSALLAVLLLSAQGPTPILELPFEHARGRIWLKATLNGQPADAILDSGAAGIYAFEPAAARANGTKGAPSTIYGAGETPAQVWQAQDLRLGLGAATVPVSHILAPAFEETPRRPIEVIAGFDLLMRYAVDVDYVGSRLRLYPSWTYHPPQGYETLRATFTGRNAVVDADLDLPGLGPQRVKALLDTGSSYGVEISRKMALREGLDELFKERPVEKGPGGLSGGTRVRPVDRAAFRLAGVDLKPEVRISMNDGGASGANADYDVLIGDDVLRHYDLVFHYWRGRVYLRPNGR